MQIVFWLALFGGGYLVAVYIWEQVRAWLVGAETEVRVLEDKLKALKAKL